MQHAFIFSSHLGWELSSFHLITTMMFCTMIKGSKDTLRSGGSLMYVNAVDAISQGLS